MSFRLESYVSDSIALVAVGRRQAGEPMHIGEAVAALDLGSGRTAPISDEELELGVVPDRLLDFVDPGHEVQALAVWASACGLAFDEAPEMSLLTPSECEVALSSGDLCDQCHAQRIEGQAVPLLAGVPPEEELAAPDGPWSVIGAPSGRYRVAFRARPEPAQWWLLDDRTIVSEGAEAVLAAVPSDTGAAVLVLPRELTHSTAPIDHEIRLVSAGLNRSIDTIPDMPSLLSFDQAHGRYVLVQLGWVPHSGSRPDLDRLVYVWDVAGRAPRWTAQPRFEADEAHIDVVADRVVLSSSRYGVTTLRLGDGYLVSDRLSRRKLRAREASYPGFADG